MKMKIEMAEDNEGQYVTTDVGDKSNRQQTGWGGSSAGLEKKLLGEKRCGSGVFRMEIQESLLREMRQRGFRR